jgi:uncharacterized Zn-finger protein
VNGSASLMPTFNMLNKNYYSHCPLKKRPIKKGDESESCGDPQPENLSTKPEDVKRLTVRSFQALAEPQPGPVLWSIPALQSSFYPFQLYSALLPHHEPYELFNYGKSKLSRDSSLSPPAPRFIEPIKQEKAAKLSHQGLAPFHQNLLPLSPTAQHLSYDSSFTSQSMPFRKLSSAKVLTDFKIATLLATTKETKERKPAVAAAARYHCPDCKKSYSTYSGLVKHQQFHCLTGNETKVPKIVSCDECGKVYASTGALKMHIRTHTLPCKCHLCGKAFSRPWLLQGHIRTHTGEKPFSCNHCHRAFADRSNLRAHLQTHSDVKKYSCTTCSKTFSRMSLLTKHNESGCQKAKL